jgi:hypothetical protein
MGATRFSGPVYGAKSLLWVTAAGAAASTSASTVNAFLQPGYGRRTVPLYEDWIITEAYLVCSTCSTVANAAQWKLKVEGGSTVMQRSNGQDSTNAATILTIASGGSSNVEKLATATSRPGNTKARGVPQDPRFGG